MTVVLRPAVESDLSFLVWAMREASTSHLERSVWSTIIDAPQGQIDDLLGAVAGGGSAHWCHLSRFRVVEVDGAPVAAASSYDPASEGNDALFAAAVQVLAVAGVNAATIEKVWERAMVVDGVTPKPYPNAWAVENVAVLPAHRGTGVVALLLDAAVDDARVHEREYVQIMCLEGNARAQRAWERSGFEVRAEYRDRRFEDLIGARGMKLLTRRVEDRQAV